MRFIPLSALLIGLTLAGTAHAAGMDEFMGKEGAKAPAAKPMGTSNVKVANPEGPVAAQGQSFSTPGGGGGADNGAPSQNKLAILFKKYHSNKDCDGMKKLVDWSGVDFWRKEGFTDELCSNGYSEITNIAFTPVEAVQPVTDANGVTRVYTLTPVAKMHIDFAPKQYANKTAPGTAPSLDLMVAKNAAGNFVLVTTKRKVN